MTAQPPDTDPRAWRGPLPADIAEQVRALATAAAAVDGVPPLSEQPLLWLTGAPAEIVHVTAAIGSGLSGYAQVDLRDPAQPSAELVVAPDARRRGIGTALLRTASTLAAGAARAPGTEPVLLPVWAHGDLPGARGLAERLGMRPVRHLWQMALDPLPPVADLPEPPGLPPGVIVRPFRPGVDEDAWLAVNARAFADHPEQGRLTRTDLDDRMAEPWFDPAGLLLAERDGSLLAFGWTKVPVDHPAEGEIYALGVDPAAQGQRLGGALTARMLAHLAGSGVNRVVLYTEGDNASAIRVYRAAGFERSAVDVVYRGEART